MRLCALSRTAAFAGCLGALAAGCDSGEDPKPVSTFLPEGRFARQLGGRVLAGTEPVAGALVHVDPTPGYAADETLGAAIADGGDLARTVPTDTAGAYRLQFAPFVHDLSIRHEREVVVFRALAVRAFDVPLTVEATPGGFHATVVPTTDPPTRAGNAVAYFVSGPDARTIAEVGASAPGWHEATFRQFDSTITLHAVEYDAARGPAAAVASGRIDIRVHQGTVVSPVVPMALVPTTVKVVFDAAPPSGYALAPFEIEMDFLLRKNARTVARVTPGAPLEIAIVEGARYAVRARATNGGAVSDSGRRLFNPLDAKVTLTLPGPVPAEAPIDDNAPAASPATTTPLATLDKGGALAAGFAKGVIEHDLEPESGAGTIVRVLTASRVTTFPDVGGLGLPRPTGRYLWTLQHYPLLPHIDNLSGEDGRISQPSWRSAPRTILVR